MRFACVTIYVNKGGNKKLYKLYTKPYTNPTSRWFSVRCEMYSLRLKLYTNYTQTLHSNYTQSPTKRRPKPYTEAFKNLHCERSRNNTRGGTQTIHFVFEHKSREWSEWSESYVTFVTNVTNETNVTNVTNVKQEMAIGGDATRHSLRLFLSLSLPLSFPPFRHSCAPPQKIQQFWAIFQRFDINIFNLREHFPPPNFAYSAHNFSLPSPNLN